MDKPILLRCRFVFFLPSPPNKKYLQGYSGHGSLFAHISSVKSPKEQLWGLRQLLVAPCLKATKPWQLYGVAWDSVLVQPRSRMIKRLRPGRTNSLLHIVWPCETKVWCGLEFCSRTAAVDNAAAARAHKRHHDTTDYLAQPVSWLWNLTAALKPF